MPRRVSLPGVDELFRSTAAPLPGITGPEPADGPSAQAARESAPGAGAPAQDAAEKAPSGRRPSRRERHDEKITVYVSAGELVELERVRLSLRAEHGLGVDRGRIVREALSVVLTDFEAKGDESILVRRLRFH